MKTLFKILTVAALFCGLNASATDGQYQPATNVVKQGYTSWYTNYGAAFTMMFPGDDAARILVEGGYYTPTNIAGSKVSFYTGNTARSAVTVAGAAVDTAISLSSTTTNGFVVPGKVVVQLPSDGCLVLDVVNVASNKLYTTQTLGVVVPVGSYVCAMNQSNVFQAMSTNTMAIPPKSFSGRYKWPLLIEVTDGGKLGVGLNYTP